MTRPRLSDFTPLPEGAYISREGWVVLNGEAWTQEELERLAARRKSDREYKRRRYHSDPAARERQKAATKRWREAHRESVAVYQREWHRRKRQALGIVPRLPRLPGPRYVGALHGLACTGPTIATGCRCHKIRCYDKPR